MHNTIPIPFVLILSTATISTSLSCVFSRRMRLLNWAPLPYWHYYHRCYYYPCCCYRCRYHYHESNSWLASSDIDRYFQLPLCPFSRLLLRTCSHVHETICTVFNVIFQSRPLLLSRFPFRLFVSSHEGSSHARGKTKNVRSESNSYIIGPSFFLPPFRSLRKEQSMSSVYLFTSFMPL